MCFVYCIQERLHPTKNTVWLVNDSKVDMLRSKYIIYKQQGPHFVFCGIRRHTSYFVESELMQVFTDVDSEIHVILVWIQERELQAYMVDVDEILMEDEYAPGDWSELQNELYMFRQC